jgi:hypothetical protein
MELRLRHRCSGVGHGRQHKGAAVDAAGLAKARQWQPDEKGAVPARTKMVEANSEEADDMAQRCGRGWGWPAAACFGLQ